MERQVRPQAGFTLIEAVVTLLVMAIMVTLGIPSMLDLLEANRVRAASSALNVALAHGRTLAITRHDRAIVCASADGSQCGPARDWSAGWIVFVDRDGDDRRDPDEPVSLSERRARDASVRVLASAGRPRVRYQKSGTSGGTNTSFTICAARALVAGRSIIVNNLGRARTAAVTGRAAACPDST
jgi:type IV fimbrial biogenesis protein FimT